MNDLKYIRDKLAYIAVMAGSYELYHRVESNFDIHFDKPITINNMQTIFEELIKRRALTCMT